MLSDNNLPETYYPVVSKPVHVSETGQYMSCLAKVSVLLVVAPQQIHIVHLALVLLDHMHQMFFQVRRIHLDNREQMKGKAIRRKACNHPNSHTGLLWRYTGLRGYTKKQKRHSCIVSYLFTFTINTCKVSQFIRKHNTQGVCEAINYGWNSLNWCSHF